MVSSNKTTTRDPKKTELSKSFTVAQYEEFESLGNRERIASLVRERFKERFTLPLECRQRHGFTIMAICCLLIETLESFYKGWTDTKGRIGYNGKTISKSEFAFSSFFQNNMHFKEFIGLEHDFYVGVRCGILHQAETTNGWHILRRGPLLDPMTKDINAAKFLKRLIKTVDQYCDNLIILEWESAEWKNARAKLHQICENCVHN